MNYFTCYCKPFLRNEFFSRYEWQKESLWISFLEANSVSFPMVEWSNWNKILMIRCSDRTLMLSYKNSLIHTLTIKWFVAFVWHGRALRSRRLFGAFFEVGQHLFIVNVFWFSKRTFCIRRRRFYRRGCCVLMMMRWLLLGCWCRRMVVTTSRVRIIDQGASSTHWADMTHAR